MRLSEVGKALACGSGHAECVHHGQLVAQGQGGGSVYPYLHLSNLVWLER